MGHCKSVTIKGRQKGQWTPSVSLRPGGIILNADVTFEDVEISFANRVRNVIMANGHTLTLNNVKRGGGAREVNLACGGLTNRHNQVTPANNGTIILKGMTQVTNIYAGSIAHQDWDPSGNPMQQDPEGVPNEYTGNATIRLENLKTGSQVENIYASGGRQTPINTDNMFDGTEPVPPKADPNRFKVSGNVTIDVSNSTVKAINGATGGAKNADITLGTVYPNTNLVLSNVGNLTVNAGSFKPTMTAEDNSLASANVTVASGATLDFQGMANKEVGSLAGDGTIVLGQSDTLTITGAATGNTKVAIGSTNNTGDASSAMALFDHPYIAAPNAPNGKFILLPNNAQQGMSFEKDGSGNWRVPQGQKPPIKVKSATIDQDASVSLDEGYAMIAVHPIFVNQIESQTLNVVPVNISVNGVPVTREGDENSGFIYKDDANNISEITISKMGDGVSADQETLYVEWTGSITPGTYKIDLVIPASHTADNHDIKLNTYLTVTDGSSSDKNLSTAKVTLDTTSFEYTGQAHTPTVKVEVEGTVLPESAYKVSYANNTNVGEASVSVVAEANSGYIGSKTEKFTITPAGLTLASADVSDKTYDGSTDATLNKITLQNKSGAEVQLQNGKDYLAGARFDDANAGTNKNVTVTVNLVGEAAQNYTLPQNTLAVQKSIAKDKTAPMHGKMQITNNLAAEYQYDLAQLLVDLEGDKRYGNTTYNVKSADLGDYNKSSQPSIKDSVLYVPIDEVASTDEKSVGTITIEITSENYDVSDTTIDVEAVNKTVPIGKPNLSTTTLTYGDKLSKITLSGEMKDAGGSKVDGVFTWINPDEQPNAGSYKASWEFIPMNSEVYQIVTGQETITINRVTPTGQPNYTPITEEKKTLADAHLTIAPDSFSTEGSVKWDMDESTEVQRGVAYGWTFTPKDTVNYHNLTGTITPYAAGGSGGGGGGGGGSIGGGETPSGGGETNPDGSTTTVEKKPNGTTITTTKYPDGSVNKVETQKDGTAIETNTTANGTVGKKVEDINGNITEISGTVSSKDAEHAKQTGEPVKVPIKVPVSDSAAQAPDIKVDVPKGGSKVEITVEQLTAGTVAVIVHRDGTEEIVRKSGLTAEGVTLTLEESATFKLVENSKPFDDVRTYDWHKDAVSFISARELMNGTSEHTFSPDATLSRGMLAVILHNMENNPDAAVSGSLNDIHGGEWYADAVYWANEKGILSGYEDGAIHPNDNITREQLAAMLYRYAGSPAVNHTLSGFGDSQQVSSYATSAMAWAVENGILSGKGNGVLDPRGQATRAEAAQMMMNFMK